jgi:hypothetical protein
MAELRTATILLTAALLTLGACAAGPSTSLGSAANRDAYNDYVGQCLSQHTDQIIEMSQIDPTYHMRFCRQFAYERMRVMGQKTR